MSKGLPILALYLGALSACGPGFDLSQPICLVEDGSFAAVDEVSRSAVNDAIADGLAQLGTRRECPSSNPPILLAYVANYSEIDGDARGGKIRLFKGITELPLVEVGKLALHELGHALGAEHIACDEGPEGVPIMCPERWLARGARYTLADIREIERHAVGER